MTSDPAPSPASTLWPLVTELIERYPARAGSTAEKESPEWGLAERIEAALLGFAKDRVPSEHWLAGASVGKGVWTHVPWAAVFDARETTQASRGVYVVMHLISEKTPGLRIGLGVATNEHKGNTERIQERACEVLDQVPQEFRDRLQRAGLIERYGEESPGLGLELPGRTGAWDSGMVCQAFVPLHEIGNRHDELNEMLEQLLHAYSRWADAHANTGGAAAAADIDAFDGQRWWVISAGVNGRNWKSFRERGIVTVGWPRVGDLRQYPDKASILDALIRVRGSRNKPTNDALALHQFSKELAPGDLIVAKQGATRIFGVGVVRSAYRYDPNSADHPHVRDVEWIREGSWSSGEYRVPVKTLTELRDYPEFRSIVDSILNDNTAEGAVAGEIDESDTDAAAYTLDNAQSELFLDRKEIEAIVQRLRRKKNLILSGPPGVGKSFAARRLAWLLLGEQSPTRVQTVQFHQSYSYEDFVQGIRPKAVSQSGSGFRVRNGPFYELCRRAEGDPDRPYVLLIDEINRGNLSRILGELMLLIEHDKRGPDHAIPLTYSEDLSDTFSVPENLHIIGMMNTADRSLSIVDYALRRRFAFVRLRPRFDSDRFRAMLSDAGASDSLIAKIVARMSSLNARIVDDKANLGVGYEIGHSFFCTVAHADDAWYEDVVRGEILPLLHEYWWEDPQKAEGVADELLG